MKKYGIIISFAVLTVQPMSNKYISYSYYDTAPLAFMSPLTSFCADSTSRDYFQAMKISTFFTSSYNSRALAAYFSPFNKQELIVKEDVTATNPFIDKEGQDILSYNFNLVTQNGNYESIVSFEPSKKVWTCQWDMAIPLQNEWSLQIAVPLVYMTTTMGMQEKIINDGAGPDNDLTDFNIGGNPQVGTMKDAFANKQMKYGKIDGKQSVTHLSDIVIKLYKEYSDKKQLMVLRPFVGIIVPTSNKPTASYMFEPIVGNGQHTGLVSGLECEKYIGAYSNFDLSFESVLNLTYLLPNHQMRSIDPAGKPWGRYLAMFASDNDRLALRYSFGINECTTRVKVDPGVRVAYNASLVAYCGQVVIKVGYQTTIHAGGYVTMPRDWSHPAIASIVQPEAQTNPARGINNLLDAFKDASYGAIHTYEMGTTTALHPFYIAHQFMVNAGIEKERNNMKFNINMGATLSCGRTNAVPTEWSIFLTCHCAV